MLNEIVNELTAIKKMKIIDFKEYFEKDKDINKLIGYQKKILKGFYFGIIFLFVIFAIVNIFMLLKEPNYDKIIQIGERVALFLATTALLTFKYASALDSEKKKDIIDSGKYFFKSFLYFIIGMIFSIGFRKSLTDPSSIMLSFLPLFDLAIITMFLLWIIGFFLLIASGYFFVRGIMSLKF